VPEMKKYDFVEADLDIIAALSNNWHKTKD